MSEKILIKKFLGSDTFVKLKTVFHFNRIVKVHTDRTRFDNATRIFSFQKQIENRQRIKILQDMQTK
jgi:hypothetical protein